MECLFAYSYLWSWGFCSMQEYNVHLDKLFSETPDSEILLDLEDCSNNCKETFARLKRYFEYEVDSFDSYKFGQILFNSLEIVYKSNIYTIVEFGYRCYQLWKLLPESLSQQEPFWTLSYADDPLSYGDEEQSRLLYEKAFCFYKENRKIQVKDVENNLSFEPTTKEIKECEKWLEKYKNQLPDNARVYYDKKSRNLEKIINPPNPIRFTDDYVEVYGSKYYKCTEALKQKMSCCTNMKEYVESVEYLAYQIFVENSKENEGWFYEINK